MRYIALILAGSTIGLLPAAGCDDTPAEREQRIENAADATGDALEKGAEKTGEVLNQAAESTGEAVNAVTDRVSRTDVDVDVDVTTRPSATTRAID
jgi:hypothetical protein